MRRLVTRREACNIASAVLIAGGSGFLARAFLRLADNIQTNDDLAALVRHRTLTPRPHARRTVATPTPAASEEMKRRAVPPAGDRAPAVPPAAAREPVRLLISSIAIDAPVVPLGLHEVDGNLVWETADHAVGHHAGTALPGEAGNCVLSGHLASPIRGEGNIFHRLPYIQPGDWVEVGTEANGDWAYNVRAIDVVDPDDSHVMDPTPEPILTLITCIPEGKFDHRLVVICDTPERIEAGPNHA